MSISKENIHNPITVKEFATYIMNSLTNMNLIEEETLPILSELIEINSLGLITFESQPVNLMSAIFSDTSFWVQRAYLNGMCEKHKVGKLATKLFEINPNIVLGETVLNVDPKKDRLQLFNFKEDGIPLKSGLYPMACCVENTNINWHDGYSGNVKHCMSREYIDDHFFEFPSELIHEIVPNYSLVQIWSQNINDNIFPTIVRALKSV